MGYSIKPVMELSIPPPFSDLSTVPPNTPTTMPTTPSTASEVRDSAESFKFPVDEIIKGLDQVIAANDAGQDANALGAERLPPGRVLGDAKVIISKLYKRIDELDATVSLLQTWNKKLQEENSEIRCRESKALKMLKNLESEKTTLERQLSLQAREASEVDEAMERTLKDLADL